MSSARKQHAHEESERRRKLRAQNLSEGLAAAFEGLTDGSDIDTPMTMDSSEETVKTSQDSQEPPSRPSGPPRGETPNQQSYEPRNKSDFGLVQARPGEKSFTLGQGPDQAQYKDRRSATPTRLMVSVTSGDDDQKFTAKIEGSDAALIRELELYQILMKLQALKEKKESAIILREQVETVSVGVNIVLSVIGIIVGVIAIRKGVGAVSRANDYSSLPPVHFDPGKSK